MFTCTSRPLLLSRSRQLLDRNYRVLRAIMEYVYLECSPTEPTCPWPREIVWMRCPVNPMSSPNFMRAFMGSAPGDNTNIRGAQQLESPNDPARSKVGGSINVCPILLTIKFWTAGIILSGRSVRRMTILSRSATMSHGEGYVKWWGFIESYISFHLPMLSCTSTTWMNDFIASDNLRGIMGVNISGSG